MRPKFWKKKKHNKKSEASLALNMLEHIEDGLEGKLTCFSVPNQIVHA